MGKKNKVKKEKHKCDNKAVKEEMIEIFGPECFIEKLKLRKDTEPRKYKGSKQLEIMRSLTYHHIEERCKGGKTTIGNGALLSNENHMWFNEQNKKDQDRMNKLFQRYKLIFLGVTVTPDGIDIEKLINDTVSSRDLPKEFLDDEIPLEDNIKERGEEDERL